MVPSYATHEPLLTPAKTVEDLFPGEKIAMSIARMPDDDNKWPAHIRSELLRNVPYLADYDVEVVLDHIEPEAGAALGYAQVRNRTAARPQDNAARAGNILRVPIIISDRRLQKFLVFEVGGQTYPLSEERVVQAMINPSPFDVGVKKIPRSASLVDQLYPPYQERQGFGRIIDPGAAGLSKISSVAGQGEKTGEKDPQSYLLAKRYIKKHRKGNASTLGFQSQEKGAAALRRVAEGAALGGLLSGTVTAATAPKGKRLHRGSTAVGIGALLGGGVGLISPALRRTPDAPPPALKELFHHPVPG